MKGEALSIDKSTIKYAYSEECWSKTLHYYIYCIMVGNVDRLLNLIIQLTLDLSGGMLFVHYLFLDEFLFF